jgi:hypothetical protein
VHVLFRPHPIRAPRESEENFFERTWRHVTMDPESVEGYRIGKNGAEKLPANYLDRMEYLQELYRVIDAVVCPMSTLLLEAMLCGVPSIASAFGDGRHTFGVDCASRMLHFKELYEVPGLIVCRARDELVGKTATLIGQIGDAKLSESLKQSTELMVSKHARPYGERIASLIDGMMKDPTTQPAYAESWRPGNRFEPTPWSIIASRSASLLERVVKRIVP